MTGRDPADAVDRKASRVLSALAARSGRVAAMAPFDRWARDPLARERIDNARRQGRPVVGYPCLQVPPEVIEAAGAVAVRIDGTARELAAAAADALPRDACGVARAARARLDRGDLDLAVVPATCAWKEILGRRSRVIVAQVPRDREARRAWASELERIARAIGRALGRRLRARDIDRAVRVRTAAAAAGRELVRRMREGSSGASGSDLLLVFATAGWAGPVAWTAAARALSAALGPPPDRDGGPRVVVTGAPLFWPEWEIPVGLEEAGARIAGEDLCGGARAVTEVAWPEERTFGGLIRALADRGLLASPCPCYGGSRRRARRLEALVRDSGAHGILAIELKGCFLYAMEQDAVRDVVRRCGAALARVEIDVDAGAPEALGTRLEAFVETLRGRARGAALRGEGGSRGR